MLCYGKRKEQYAVLKIGIELICLDDRLDFVDSGYPFCDLLTLEPARRSITDGSHR